MEQRISLITLGVSELGRARSFYEALGWAGAQQPPALAEWGGTSGAFADPDGYVWEVAHNAGWTITDDGSIRI